MKKVILSIILLIGNVFAVSDSEYIDSIKSDLETYTACISALSNSIIGEPGKLKLDQDLLCQSLFDSSEEASVSESDSSCIEFEDEEESSDVGLFNTNQILEPSSLSLSFADDSDALNTINKYSPKIMKYLKETLEDIETYIGNHGFIKAFDILHKAIDNAAFGRSEKMREKREILTDAFSELISQM